MAIPAGRVTEGGLKPLPEEMVIEVVALLKKRTIMLIGVWAALSAAVIIISVLFQINSNVFLFISSLVSMMGCILVLFTGFFSGQKHLQVINPRLLSHVQNDGMLDVGVSLYIRIIVFRFIIFFQDVLVCVHGRFGELALLLRINCLHFITVFGGHVVRLAGWKRRVVLFLRYSWSSSCFVGHGVELCYHSRSRIDILYVNLTVICAHFAN
jgi:hypothetical protein